MRATEFVNDQRPSDADVSPPIVRRQIDVFDKSGQWHALIVVAPVLYGVWQTTQGRAMEPWYWWLCIATAGFALFARRTPLLRFTPTGLSLPSKKTPEYSWDQMCEAQARQDGIDLILSDGQRVSIEFRSLKISDVTRIRRIIKAQFQRLAERAQTRMSRAA
jgi:hypothetical protein